MATIRRGAYITLLLAISCLPAFSQTPELINDPAFRPVAQAAVDSIYDFNFEAAQKIIKPWRKRYPNHPLWTLMHGMTFWWKVLSDLEDTSNDEQFFYIMKRADYEASKLLRKNSTHADGLIIKAVSNGYIARQYANRDEWLKSINRARRALSAHDYLLQLEPNLADLKLAQGLKLYYSAYLPEAYPIVKTVSWFLPEGDKKKGLELMKIAADSAIFARAEATYFLGNINYNYQKDYSKAAYYFRKLYERYPNNNYYARIYVKSLYRMKRFEQALAVINESLQRWQSKKLAYGPELREELLTWKGRILDRENKRSEALNCFKEAFSIGKRLPRTDYRDFHIISAYYAGKLLYEAGQLKQAGYYLKQAKSGKTEDAYRDSAARLLNKIK